MPFSKHTAPIGEIKYTSQSRQTLEIDRTGVLTYLKVQVDFTVTSGTTGPSTPLFLTLARLLERVEVVINGRDTTYNMTGAYLAARAIYEQGKSPYGLTATVVTTGSTTVTNYSVVIPIPFTLPRSANPLLCALPAERLGQISLAVTWGNSDASGLFATPNSAAVSAVTCKVEAEYLLGASPDQVFLARVLDMQTEEVTATTSNKQVVIDTGTGLRYRSLYLISTRDNVAVNDIINEINFESGTQVFQKRSNVFLQAENQRIFQQDAPQTGVYALTTEMFGLSEMWLNSSRDVLPADLRLTLDVTKGSGTTQNIDILRESVRPFKR